MKKYLGFILLFAICFTHLISYNQVYATTKQVQNVQDFKIDIQYEPLNETIKDENGIPMLVIQGNSPIMTIEGNRKAATRINAFYKEKGKAFKVQAEELVKRAHKDYSNRTKEQREYWQGYELGRTYTTGRVDNKVISFIENDFEDTAGAHPNSLRYAQTFSPITGKRLTLKDITTNVGEATQSINAYILEETKKDKYKDYFFDDYEKHIKEILTEDTWYFSDQGLVIISNEYIISPHSVGILEFTIPYGELTYIKKEYLP